MRRVDWPASATSTYLTVPVPRVLAPNPHHLVLSRRGWPQVEQILVDDALGELALTSGVPAMSADAQPVGARLQADHLPEVGPAPRRPLDRRAGGNGYGDLHDVFEVERG